MAGPVASIIVKSELTDALLVPVWDYLNSTSDDEYASGEDFWVQQRPLGCEFGEELEGELAELAGLKPLIGWAPLGIITLVAYCNQPIDHEILGNLALDIAEIVEGLIAFDHVLAAYTSDTEILRHPGLVELNGEAFLSTELFSLWRVHKDFQMVK